MPNSGSNTHGQPSSVPGSDSNKQSRYSVPVHNPYGPLGSEDPGHIELDMFGDHIPANNPEPTASSDTRKSRKRKKKRKQYKNPQAALDALIHEHLGPPLASLIQAKANNDAEAVNFPCPEQPSTENDAPPTIATETIDFVEIGLNNPTDYVPEGAPPTAFISNDDLTHLLENAEAETSDPNKVYHLYLRFKNKVIVVSLTAINMLAFAYPSYQAAQTIGEKYGWNEVITQTVSALSGLFGGGANGGLVGWSLIPVMSAQTPSDASNYLHYNKNDITKCEKFLSNTPKNTIKGIAIVSVIPLAVMTYFSFANDWRDRPEKIITMFALSALCQGPTGIVHYSSLIKGLFYLIPEALNSFMPRSMRLLSTGYHQLNYWYRLWSGSTDIPDPRLARILNQSKGLFAQALADGHQLNMQLFPEQRITKLAEIHDLLQQTQPDLASLLATIGSQGESIHPIDDTLFEAALLGPLVLLLAPILLPSKWAIQGLGSEAPTLDWLYSYKTFPIHKLFNNVLKRLDSLASVLTGTVYAAVVLYGIVGYYQATNIFFQLLAMGQMNDPDNGMNECTQVKNATDGDKLFAFTADWLSFICFIFLIICLAYPSGSAIYAWVKRQTQDILYKMGLAAEPSKPVCLESEFNPRLYNFMRSISYISGALSAGSAIETILESCFESDTLVNTMILASFISSMGVNGSGIFASLLKCYRLYQQAYGKDPVKNSILAYDDAVGDLITQCQGIHNDACRKILGDKNLWTNYFANIMQAGLWDDDVEYLMEKLAHTDNAANEAKETSPLLAETYDSADSQSSPSWSERLGNCTAGLKSCLSWCSNWNAPADDSGIGTDEPVATADMVMPDAGTGSPAMKADASESTVVNAI